MAISDKVITYKAENKVLKLVTIGMIALLSVATIIMTILFVVVPRGGGQVTSAASISLSSDNVEMSIETETLIKYEIGPDTATNKEVDLVGVTAEGYVFAGQDQKIAKIYTIFEEEAGKKTRYIKIEAYRIEGEFTFKVRSKQKADVVKEITVSISKKYISDISVIGGIASQSPVSSLMFLKKQNDQDVEARKIFIKIAPADATETTVTARVTDDKGADKLGLSVYPGTKQQATDTLGNPVPGIFIINAASLATGVYNLHITVNKSATEQKTVTVPVRVVEAISEIKLKDESGSGLLEVAKSENINIRDIIEIYVKDEAGKTVKVADNQIDSFLDGINFDSTDILVVDRIVLQKSKIIAAAAAFNGEKSSDDAKITATSSFENNKILGTFDIRMKIPVSGMDIDGNRLTYNLRTDSAVNYATVKALPKSAYKASPYNNLVHYEIVSASKDGGATDEEVVRLEKTGNADCKVTAISYGMAVIRAYSDDNTDVEQLITVYIKHLAISLDGGNTFAEDSALINYKIRTTVNLKDLIYVRSHLVPKSITSLHNEFGSYITFTAGGAARTEFNATNTTFTSTTAISDLVNTSMTLTANVGFGDWTVIGGTLILNITKYDYADGITISNNNSLDTYVDYTETAGVKSYTYSYYNGTAEIKNSMFAVSDLVTVTMQSGYSVPDARRELSYSFSVDGKIQILTLTDESGTKDYIKFLGFSESPIIITIGLKNKRPAIPGVAGTGDTTETVTFTVKMIQNISAARIETFSVGQMLSDNTKASYFDGAKYIIAAGKSYELDVSFDFITLQSDSYKIVSTNTSMLTVTDINTVINAVNIKKAAADNLITLEFWRVRVIKNTTVEERITSITVLIATDIDTLGVSMFGRVSSSVAPYELRMNSDYNQDNGGIEVTFKGAPIYSTQFPPDLATTVTSTAVEIVNPVIDIAGLALVPVSERAEPVTVTFTFLTNYRYSDLDADGTVKGGERIYTFYVKVLPQASYEYAYKSQLRQGETTTVGVTGGGGEAFTYTVKEGASNSGMVILSSADNGVAENEIITAPVYNYETKASNIAHLVVTISKVGGTVEDVITKDLYITILPVTIAWDVTVPAGGNKLYPNNPGAANVNNRAVFTSVINNINNNVTPVITYTYSNPSLTEEDSANSSAGTVSGHKLTNVLALNGIAGRIGGVTRVTVTYSFSATLGGTVYSFSTERSYELNVEGINPAVIFKVNGTAVTEYTVDAGENNFLLIAQVNSIPVKTGTFTITVANDNNRLVAGTPTPSATLKGKQDVADSADNMIYTEYGMAFALNTASGGMVVLEVVLEYDGLYFTKYFTVTVNPLAPELKFTSVMTGTPAGTDLEDAAGVLYANDSIRLLPVNGAGKGLPAIYYSVDRPELVDITNIDAGDTAQGVRITAKTGTFGGVVRITAYTKDASNNIVVSVSKTVTVYEVTASQFTTGVSVNGSAAAATVKQSSVNALTNTVTHTETVYNGMIGVAATGFTKAVTYTYTGVLGQITGSTNFTATNKGVGGSLTILMTITLTDKNGAQIVLTKNTASITVKEIDVTVTASVNEVSQGGSVKYTVDAAKLGDTSFATAVTMTVKSVVKGSALIVSQTAKDTDNMPLIATKIGTGGGPLEIIFTVTVGGATFDRTVTVTVLNTTLTFTFDAYTDAARTAAFTGVLPQDTAVYFGVGCKSGTTDVTVTSITYTSGSGYFVKDLTTDYMFTAAKDWVGGTVTVHADVLVNGVSYSLSRNIDIEIVRPEISVAALLGGSAFNLTSGILNQGGSALMLSVVEDGKYLTSTNQKQPAKFKVISGSNLADFDAVTLNKLVSKNLSAGGTVTIEVTVYPENQIFSYIFTVNIAKITVTASSAITVAEGSNATRIILTVNNSNLTSDYIFVSVPSGGRFISTPAYDSTHLANTSYLFNAYHSYGGTAVIRFTAKESSASTTVWASYDVTVTITGATAGITDTVINDTINQGATGGGAGGYDFGITVPTGFSLTTEVFNITGDIMPDASNKFKITANITGKTVSSSAVVVYKITVTSSDIADETIEYMATLKLTVNSMALSISGLASPLSLTQDTEYTNIGYTLSQVTLPGGSTVNTVYSLSGTELAAITKADSPAKFKTKKGTLGGEVNLILTLTIVADGTVIKSNVTMTATLRMKVSPISQFEFSVKTYDGSDTEITTLIMNTPYNIKVTETTLGEVTVTSLKALSIGAGYIINIDAGDNLIASSGFNLVTKDGTLGGIVTVQIGVTAAGITHYVYKDIYVQETDPVITYLMDNAAYYSTIYYDSNFILKPVVTGHVVGNGSEFTLDSVKATITNQNDGTARINIANKDVKLTDKTLTVDMKLIIDGRAYYRTLEFTIEGVVYTYNGAASINTVGGGADTSTTLGYNITKGYSTVRAVTAGNIGYTLTATPLAALAGNVLTANSNVISGTVTVTANITGPVAFSESKVITVNGVTPAFEVIKSGGGAISAAATYDKGTSIRPVLSITNTVSMTTGGFAGFRIISGGQLAANESGLLVFNTAVLTGGNTVIELSYEIDGEVFTAQHTFIVNPVAVALSVDVTAADGSPVDYASDPIPAKSDIAVSVDVSGVNSSLVTAVFGMTGNPALYKEFTTAGLDVSFTTLINYESNTKLTLNILVRIAGGDGLYTEISRSVEFDLETDVQPVFAVVDASDSDNIIAEGAVYDQGAVIKPELTQTAAGVPAGTFSGFSIISGGHLAAKVSDTLVIRGNTAGGEIKIRLAYTIDGDIYTVDRTINAAAVTTDYNVYDVDNDTVVGDITANFPHGDYILKMDVAGIDSDYIRYIYTVTAANGLITYTPSDTDEFEFSLNQTISGGNINIHVQVRVYGNDGATGAYTAHNHTLNLTLNGYGISPEFELNDITNTKEITSGTEYYNQGESAEFEFTQTKAGITGGLFGNIYIVSGGGLATVNNNVITFKTNTAGGVVTIKAVYTHGGFTYETPEMIINVKAYDASISINDEDVGDITGEFDEGGYSLNVDVDGVDGDYIRYVYTVTAADGLVTYTPSVTSELTFALLKTISGGTVTINVQVRVYNNINATGAYTAYNYTVGITLRGYDAEPEFVLNDITDSGDITEVTGGEYYNQGQSIELEFAQTNTEISGGSFSNIYIVNGAELAVINNNVLIFKTNTAGGTVTLKAEFTYDGLTYYTQEITVNVNPYDVSIDIDGTDINSLPAEFEEGGYVLNVSVTGVDDSYIGYVYTVTAADGLVTYTLSDTDSQAFTLLKTVSGGVVTIDVQVRIYKTGAPTEYTAHNYSVEINLKGYDAEPEFVLNDITDSDNIIEDINGEYYNQGQSIELEFAQMNTEISGGTFSNIYIVNGGNLATISGNVLTFKTNTAGGAVSLTAEFTYDGVTYYITEIVINVRRFTVSYTVTEDGSDALTGSNKAAIGSAGEAVVTIVAEGAESGLIAYEIQTAGDSNIYTFSKDEDAGVITVTAKPSFTGGKVSLFMFVYLYNDNTLTEYETYFLRLEITIEPISELNVELTDVKASYDSMEDITVRLSNYDRSYINSTVTIGNSVNGYTVTVTGEDTAYTLPVIIDTDSGDGVTTAEIDIIVTVIFESGLTGEYKLRGITVNMVEFVSALIGSGGINHGEDTEIGVAINNITATVEYKITDTATKAEDCSNYGYVSGNHFYAYYGASDKEISVIPYFRGFGIDYEAEAVNITITGADESIISGFDDETVAAGDTINLGAAIPAAGETDVVVIVYDILSGDEYTENPTYDDGVLTGFDIISGTAADSEIEVKVTVTVNGFQYEKTVTYTVAESV